MLLKKFFRFVLPSVLSMWIFALYTMFDGIFVAHGIGEYALAAVNISMPYTIFIFSIGLLMATGASTLVNIYMGEGKIKEAQNTFNQNLVILFIIGVTISVLTLLNLEKLAYFLGATAETIEYVKKYLGCIAVFTVFFMISYNLEIFVKSDGSPQLQIVGVSLCAIGNVIMDYIFVLKLHRGVEWAALSTGLAQVLSTTMFMVYFKFKGKKLTLKKFRFNLAVYKRILPLGLSDSLTEMSGGFVIFIFNQVILAVIGSKGLVSYTVISYVNTLVLNSMAGISQGVQPLVSYHYGAGKWTHCHKLLKYAIVTASVSGIFFLCIALFAPQLPVSMFLNQDNMEFFSYAVTAMQMYGISFSFVGLNVVMAGYFTAIERPIYSIVISSARSFVVLSLCLITMTAQLGEYGIWLSTAVSEALCLLITLCFFFRYVRQKKKRPALAF